MGRHRETWFDDFARQPLLPNQLSQLGGVAVDRGKFRCQLQAQRPGTHLGAIEDPDLADIRVVVWSASAEGAGPAALEAGADAFLIKEPGAEDDAAAALSPPDPEG